MCFPTDWSATLFITNETTHTVYSCCDICTAKCRTYIIKCSFSYENTFVYETSIWLVHNGKDIYLGNFIFHLYHSIHAVFHASASNQIIQVELMHSRKNMEKSNFIDFYNNINNDCIRKIQAKALSTCLSIAICQLTLEHSQSYVKRFDDRMPYACSSTCTTNEQ